MDFFNRQLVNIRIFVCDVYKQGCMKGFVFVFFVLR